MTIRLLKTLVAIADNKTFSAAAEVVHVTHAAVSQQMRTLEADLGIELFDRSTRTPELTPVAQRIVAKARELIRDYDNLVPSVSADGGMTGVVKLGALRTTLTGLTPQALAILKSKYAEIGFRIRPGLTGPLLAAVERGELDAAIVVKPHLVPDGIWFRELIVEPMELIASMEDEVDDPLVLLRTRPFIRFNRNAVVGTLIDNWILSNGIRVDETMELDSPEAIGSMVKANLGVSIVPKLAVKPFDSVPLKHLPLGKDAPTRVLGLAHRKDQVKTRFMDELFDAMRQAVEMDNAQ